MMAKRNVVESLYYSRTLDQMLLAWVDCGRRLIPSAPIEQHIRNFVEYYDLEQFNIEVDSLKVTYSRMQKKYYDACRTDKKNINR